MSVGKQNEQFQIYMTDWMKYDADLVLKRNFTFTFLISPLISRSRIKCKNTHWNTKQTQSGIQDITDIICLKLPFPFKQWFFNVYELLI